MTLSFNIARAILSAAFVVLGGLELLKIVSTISRDVTQNGRN